MTMITACLFEEQARRAGLEFISWGKAEEFEAMIRDPRIWKLGQGTKVVFDFAAKAVEKWANQLTGSTPKTSRIAFTAPSCRWNMPRHASAVT